MLTVRCRDCNKELTSGTQVQSCGCPNMMTLHGDSVTAVDLGRVYMLNSSTKNSNNNLLSPQDLNFQEERRKRKVRKLDFEIR